MTECTQEQFALGAHFSRPVAGWFDSSRLTTYGGELLLRQTVRKIGLRKRVVRGFTDARDRERTEHGLEQMPGKRIYELTLGQEDLNDHEELRHDPLLGVLAGRRGREAKPAEAKREKKNSAFISPGFTHSSAPTARPDPPIGELMPSKRFAGRQRALP